MVESYGRNKFSIRIFLNMKQIIQQMIDTNAFRLKKMNSVYWIQISNLHIWI